MFYFDKHKKKIKHIFTYVKFFMCIVGKLKLKIRLYITESIIECVRFFSTHFTYNKKSVKKNL